VESNSPAALAGLQKGDLLVEIGKYTLKNKLDFYRALLDLKGNEEIAFTFFRNNEFRDTAVAVRSPRSGSFAQRAATPPPQPATVTPRTASEAAPNTSRTSRAAEMDTLVWENLGISYSPIPAKEFEQTYRKHLSKFDGGILVKEVRPGSPAEQGSLQSGDVVTGIGPWAMTLANDVRYIGAQEWTKVQLENKILRADVIRDNTHYETEIPTR
jgi:S1-C subfamily serine protease